MGARERSPLKIQVNLKTYSPSPYRKGTDSIPVSLREGGERAPVALCREPVYVATPVGAERSPLATSARAGRRDGGEHHRAMAGSLLRCRPWLASLAAAPLAWSRSSAPHLAGF